MSSENQIHSLLDSEQSFQSDLVQIANYLIKNSLFLTTAESCTGGLISAACTELAGSSQWFECGFVTYSNRAKTQLLGVPDLLIANMGAVSQQVAMAMAEGAIANAAAQVSLAVTGIAGPTGGSPGKPVGTVWIAWHTRGETTCELHHFTGHRQAVRLATVHAAIKGLRLRLIAA